MSLADGLLHAPIQFRDGAMRSDKSNIPGTRRLRAVSGSATDLFFLRNYLIPFRF
jgi:hypothetical protein